MWRSEPESGVQVRAEAVEASVQGGSQLQGLRRWAAGQDERRGSCTLTPPHCPGLPLLPLNGGLEKV